MNICKQMITVLEERIEELKADIKEFTELKLEAKSKIEDFRYHMLICQTEMLLDSTYEGIEHYEELYLLEEELYKRAKEIGPIEEIPKEKFIELCKDVLGDRKNND